MAQKRLIVKKRIREMAESADDLSPNSPEYQDIMANVEGQVQKVLEEEGHIKY